MALAKLRIEQPEVSPSSTKVWLNDQDITGCLVSVRLDWQAREITEATLTIGIGDLEIDARAIANLIGRISDPAELETIIQTLKRAKATHAHSEHD